MKSTKTLSATEQFISEKELRDRIAVMASEVITRYEGKNPLFICLLRGAVPFTAMLMTEIARQNPDFHPRVDYIQTKTYGEGFEARKPEIVFGHEVAKGEDLVVALDDVLDTGTTIAYLEDHFRTNCGVSQVDLVVLAEKQIAREVWPTATISGFTAPNDWLVGMGMDNPSVAPEAFRWMPEVTTAVVD